MGFKKLSPETQWGRNLLLKMCQGSYSTEPLPQVVSMTDLLYQTLGRKKQILHLELCF